MQPCKPHHVLILYFMAVTLPVAGLSYIYTLVDGSASVGRVIGFATQRLALTLCVACACHHNWACLRSARTVVLVVLPFAAHGFLYTEAAFLCSHTLGFTRTFGDALLSKADVALFGCDANLGCSHSLRTLLPWKPLGEYLYFCYFSYYFLLPCLWLRAWAAHRRRGFDMDLLFFTSFACVLSPFLLYYTMPVRGPESVYGLPPAPSWSYFFGSVCNSLVEAKGSAGTATPSSHAIMAIVVWACAYRMDRTTFVCYCAVCPGLLLATVWCGYHYVMDVVASAVLCAVVLRMAPRVYVSLLRD